MASEKTIQIVKATAPVLQEHGEKITEVFYKRLFKNNPELRDVFNMTHQKRGTQPRALANAVYQYAVHIDKLSMLSGAVESIAQKHASLSVPKEAYPIVGTNLLAAIKEVLGDAATDEIMNAWEEAYGDLAAIFVDREEQLYTEKENEEGGYRGQKDFVVFKKVKESDVITSFYLKPIDGGMVPKFKAGQYIAITVDIPDTEHKHTRNYSLSDSSGLDYLRISVKREEGNPEGIVSNFMHSSIQKGSIIKAGIPAGEFVLADTNQPLVFISGGVGVTPLLSMLKEAVANGKKDITFIQCALNSEVRAFHDEINAVIPDKAKYINVFSLPTAKDVADYTYDYKGLLTSEILNDLQLPEDSMVYFCGPNPFMASLLKVLEGSNIKPENILYEFFGPAEELEN